MLSTHTLAHTLAAGPQSLGAEGLHTFLSSSTHGISLGLPPGVAEMPLRGAGCVPGGVQHSGDTKPDKGEAGC